MTESRSGSGVRDASVRELQEEDLSSNGEETSARLEAQVEKDEDKERRRGYCHFLEGQSNSGPRRGPVCFEAVELEEKVVDVDFESRCVSFGVQRRCS